MKKKCLLWIFICLSTFIMLKTTFSNVLFANKTCGMKNLIQKGEIDNLYIGSSMFRQGLDIDELQERIPEESHYILAYNGNQPIWEYMQLEYLLKNNVKIKTLYIDMYAYSICKEPELDDEKMFLEFSYGLKRKIFEYIINDMSWSEKWHLWVSSCNEMILFWPIYSHIVDSQFRNGGTLLYSSGSTKEKLDNMSVEGYPTTVNSVQIEFIEDIIKLAHENGIQVVFVETPKYSKVQFDDSYCGLMEAYKGILEEQDVKYISVDKELDCNDFALFQDLIHLSSEGRKEFTQVLCDKIKEGRY